MLTSDSLSTLRRIMFTITGLTCLAYAVLAILQMRPDPFPFWIPGSLGLISAALIFALASAAGRKNAQQAFDEGYIHGQTPRRGACVLDCIDVVPDLWGPHGHGRGCPAHGICGDGDPDGGGLSIAVHLL